MNPYELIAIITEATTEEGLAKISEKIQKLIQDKKGKIISEENLGRKKLAYPIKKNQFGDYLVFQFNLLGEQIKSLTKELNAESEILRFMIAKTEKKTQEKPELKTEKPSPVKDISIIPEKIIEPEIKTEEKIKPQKVAIIKSKKVKPKITKEIESEEERMKKLDQELGKILEE